MPKGSGRSQICQNHKDIEPLGFPQVVNEAECTGKSCWTDYCWCSFSKCVSYLDLSFLFSYLFKSSEESYLRNAMGKLIGCTCFLSRCSVAYYAATWLLGY